MSDIARKYHETQEERWNISQSLFRKAAHELYLRGGKKGRGGRGGRRGGGGGGEGEGRWFGGLWKS